MLVYCNSLNLTGSGDMEKALTIIAKWLGQHAGVFVAPQELSSRSIQKKTDRGQYQIIAATESCPMMHSIQFSEPDNRVGGRQWTTEIGIRQNDPGLVDITILLKTSEISSRVQGFVVATRPRFVKEISGNCSLAQDIPGQFTKTLDESSASAFLQEVKRPERRYPIVIVSPIINGGYWLDTEYLRSMLVGLADVVKIPEGADTYEIANKIGSRYSAWAGAINIILNPRRCPDGQFIANSLILADEIVEIQESGRKIVNDILTRIVHRTNLPFSWRHISPQIVKEKQLKDDLERHRRLAASSGEQTDYLHALEGINTEQVNTISSLEQEKSTLENTVLDQEDELRRCQYDIQNLKTCLNKSSCRKTEVARVSDDERKALRGIAERCYTPKNCLICISLMYGDRIVILDDSWDACEQSRNFKFGEQLFPLLVKFAGEYWDALAQGGKGDSEARKILGSHYAAQESEKVKNNPDLRRFRTFQYKGSDVLMLSHLRIGTKDSVEDTIRVHFHWDSTDKVLVIGYCGPHLPLNV
jgi:uncharacterized protein (UPF0335 family)